MKVTRFVLLFISSLCMLSTFAQDRDFSFDIYDYIVLLPTVEEYSITLDRDGKTLLRHRDTDLFGMHDVVVDTFDKERELKSNGSRKPVQLLTFDEYESTEWLRAKRSSTCFLSTDVAFSGISDERYDVHVVWRFFDIREGYKKPAFEIKRSRNLPLFLMSGLGLLEAEVDEISDEIRSQVKKAWYYQVYNETLSKNPV
ncbi:hypothetical protein N8134_05280 [Flavobacteriales bacterium]|nr:hypothetical protein [Flavobacteriales bacterium]